MAISGKSRNRLAIVSIALLVILIGVMGVGELLVKRPQQLYLTASGTVDMCLSCHTEEKLDSAHGADVIGCAPCHLGNPLAIKKEDAHKGMTVNPGDLRMVDRTCSIEGCHPADVHKVKNSLMATNRGILGTLLYYWGESNSQNTDLTVEKLIESGQNSFALDYYRKLCGTCHLWKQKNDIQEAPEFFKEKGGGCSACHFQIPEEKTTAAQSLVADTASVEKKNKKAHPHITAKVDQTHCIRCHNRSGRIGLSYIGIFESEGYGTPYEKGEMTQKQLPGARFYLEMADDIHHNKGMQCIDCHTRNEIMGDGNSYAHYEDQLEISCTVCHSTSPGTTRKNNVLNNLVGTTDNPALKGKIDGAIRPLHPPRPGVCDFSAHKRVTCEACHSTWVPQCYGCHVKQDKRGKHLDKLSIKETAGLWEEGRSYIRYEKPMLGIWENEVVIVTPGCQDMVTVVGEDGQDSGGFNRFTMAAINPHTTQKKGRECNDCHGSPKTLGLGEGTIYRQGGKLRFQSAAKGVATSIGQTVPLDAWVDIDGKQLQHGSRPNVRPFNGDELRKIVQVGFCADCHDSYQDPMWQKYTADLACPATEKTSSVDTSTERE